MAAAAVAGALKALKILSAVQGAGGLLQKGQSALMRRKARREFQPYEIPSSAKAMLDKATSVASLRGVPGEDIYRSQAQASVARGTEAAQRTAESPSDVLSVLSRLHGGYQGFEQNLAVQGEQSYERRQSQLMNALSRFSQFEQERWNYNELYPYMQAMGEAGQMDMAGNQNLQSAVSTGMNIYGAQADMDFQREQFDKWKSTMFNSNARSGLNTPPPNIPAPLNVDYRTPLYDRGKETYEPNPPLYGGSWSPYQ